MTVLAPTSHDPSRTHSDLELETEPAVHDLTSSRPSLNLGCGRDVRPRSRGWTNMDAFYEDPAVVRHDMVRTPWPFPDNAFERVYASHVLEHTPVLYRERDGVKRDVLFDVMEEVHRVLTPGGLFHLRVPLAGTGLAYGHPQHYRHVHPGWFTYFSPTHPENYYSTARFTIEAITRRPFGTRLPGWLPLGKSRLGLLEHVTARLPWTRRVLGNRCELDVRLRCVKTRDDTNGGARS